MTKPRTADDFLRELHDADKTVADWCREHGFAQALAYRVLNGKSLGRWGQVRRIARAMNLPLPSTSAHADKRATQGA